MSRNGVYTEADPKPKRKHKHTVYEWHLIALTDDNTPYHLKNISPREKVLKHKKQIIKI